MESPINSTIVESLNPFAAELLEQAKIYSKSKKGQVTVTFNQIMPTVGRSIMSLWGFITEVMPQF